MLKGTRRDMFITTLLSYCMRPLRRHNSCHKISFRRGNYGRQRKNKKKNYEHQNKESPNCCYWITIRRGKKLSYVTHCCYDQDYLQWWSNIHCCVCIYRLISSMIFLGSCRFLLQGIPLFICLIGELIIWYWVTHGYDDEHVPVFISERERDNWLPPNNSSNKK